MQISALNLPGVKLVVPKRFTDARGSFSEIWIDRHFREEIANVAFVQDNESVSVRKGTVRGLLFQLRPIVSCFPRKTKGAPARVICRASLTTRDEQESSFEQERFRTESE
jgi:dTDP-4-dehydrorhamnose 3,5-epimerase-like enzyme